MRTLSEVTILMGARARDIEKAREIFTAEIRSFVSGVLGGIRLIRSDPWTTSRLKIDLPKEVDTEAKAASDFSSQYAIARIAVRFKKGTNFQQIADVRVGIEFDEVQSVFLWQGTLVPSAKYNKVDDAVWLHWRNQQTAHPSAAHQDKANTVRFFSRPLSAEVTAETAFNDVKSVLEFLLTIESALSETLGVED
jgi:hypothetical protein